MLTLIHDSRLPHGLYSGLLVQILFGLLYIINLGIVLFIYMKTDAVWNVL